MEIRTLPTIADGADRLVEMHGDWRQLTERRGLGPEAFNESARDVAQRVVAMRSSLFERNAAIQAEHAVIDPEWDQKLDANQDAIKFCTIILGEISAALGMTSLPPT